MDGLLMSVLLLAESSLLLIENFGQTIIFGFVLFEFVDDLGAGADSDVLDKFGIFFMQKVVLSFQLFDLVLIAELGLHK